MTTNRYLSAAFLFPFILFYAMCALGQQVSSSLARVRIKSPVDESRMVTLKGNVHPLARAEYDGGAVPDSLPIRRMLLVLSRSSEQEKDLQQLLEDQQTPGSPRFRKWLTPSQFGETYGPADADIQTITSWLGSQGFHVDQVSSGKSFIEFSGNAAEVRQAFRTQMHQYTVGGKIHYANATDPEIPVALAPVVKGIASLNNFDRKPAARNFGIYHRDLTTGEVTPEYTIPTSNGTYYAIGPADFATIYNTQPLQTANITGTGQTIAVLGVSNINLQDIADFRNLFGLGAGNTSVVLDGADPGIVDGAEFEALLDVEWANATAPGASVVLVTSSGSESTGGLELAALHVIENNLASVLSVSYGFCEAALGTTENQFIQTLWQQASAQGITVVVSSGDSGSAACEDFNTATMAKTGISVSGIASTPYNVAAGGTDFNYTLPASSFWSSTNNTTTLLSAKSYIPEMTWNSSCASSATSSNLGVCPPLPDSGTPPDSLNVMAGSGGPSTCSSKVDSGGTQVCQGTPKPSWQTGPGVPQDGVRDVPDISLFSAINSKGNALYVLCAADQLPPGYSSCQRNNGVYFLGAGGTSVAAPTFAGIVALANQKSGGRLGNLNYLLYSLAAQPGASCTSGTTQAAGCIFHDVVNGNISVPCAAGSPNCSATSGTQTGVLVDKNGAPAYPATAGYDFATGLGSVNGANLVNAIANAVTGFKPSTTALQLNGATSPITAKHGDPIAVTVNVAPTEATGSVSLLGATGGIDLRDLSGGVASWTTRLFPGGNYTAKAHYAGDGTRGASDSNGVSVAISPEDSKTFVNLLTFDLNGNPLSYTASTTEYGSPYILRMDVADSAATITSDKGVSSNCTNHLTSCATGSVSLTANGAPLDGGNFAITADGLAEDFQVQLAPGTYSLAASYAGDASYGPSSGTNSVVITKATTTTSVDVPPGTLEYGHSLSFTATVNSHSNGAPMSMDVSFLFDGQPRYEAGSFNPLSPAPAYSYLHLTLADSLNQVGTIGTHTLTARFGGDTNYASSTSDPVTITIVPATTSISINASPNPGVPRAPVVLTGYVSSPYGSFPTENPTGTVIFYDNGVSIGSVPTSNGNVSLSYTFTQLGTHNITASYSGDSNYKSTADSNLIQLAIQDKIPSAAQSLFPFIDPAVVNYPIPLQAVFNSPQQNSPPLTGTVTFNDNGQPMSGTVNYTTNLIGNYIAALNAIFTKVGTHVLTATYSGDVNYLPVTATIPAFNVVAKAQSQVSPTNVDRIAIVTQPVTLSAYVYGVPNGPPPSGTITFLDNGVPLQGTVTLSGNANAQASMSYTFTTTGIHNLSAQYSGDSFYTTATGTSIGYEIQGLIWMELPRNEDTFSPSGGSTQLNFSLINNTQNDANITLTCTSSSTAATCNVSNPVSAVPAQSRTQVSVDITVPGRTASVHDPANWWIRSTGVLFGAVFMGAGLVDRRRRKTLLLVIAFAMLITLPSCGGGGGSNNRGTTPPPVTPPPTTTPIKYTFTITASDGGANSVSQTYTANVQ